MYHLSKKTFVQNIHICIFISLFQDNVKKIRAETQTSVMTVTMTTELLWQREMKKVASELN